MKKIIIRTKIVSNVSSSIICESEENETFCDVIARIGKQQVLVKIFNEDGVTYDDLYQDYMQFKEGGKVLALHGCM